MTTLTLEHVAGLVGGQASEIPGPAISGVRPVEFADEHDITYVVNPRFVEKLQESRAGAVIVPPGLDPAGKPHIVAANPEAAFARLTAVFYPYPQAESGVSPRAEIGAGCSLGKDVSIGPFAVLGRGVTIGDRSVIGPHVVLGDDVRIGEDTRLFPQVTVYSGVTIGNRVIVHSGTVLGADGFGYAPDRSDKGETVHVKKYHSGGVEIEDDVEIGALCAVDRALAGVTRIGRGAKLDNLIQVAHNVTIGQGTVVASQVGIAGSSSVGAYCLIGGQVGVRDHVSVGDGVILATRVGIYRNVAAGSVMAGSVPAMRHDVFLRAQSLFKRLPEMLERIRKLERFVSSDRKELE